MFSLADTHCHLDFDQFDADYQDVLARSWESGIQRILIPEVEIDPDEKMIRLSEMDDRIFAAVGVHPNSADTWNSLTMSKLRRSATHPRVVAIGEIGLDYYRHHTSPELQQRILKEQLSLAAEVDKPVILHCRNAFNDLFNILMNWREQLPKTAFHLNKVPGVLHSFGGDLQQADTATKAGFMLGINGSISFKNAGMIKNVVQTIALEYLLLETDAPFISPVPHRGERNEPSFIQYTNLALANLSGISPEQCAKMTYNNSSKIFLW